MSQIVLTEHVLIDRKETKNSMEKIGSNKKIKIKISTAE